MMQFLAAHPIACFGIANAIGVIVFGAVFLHIEKRLQIIEHELAGNLVDVGAYPLLRDTHISRRREAIAADRTKAMS